MVRSRSPLRRKNDEIRKMIKKIRFQIENSYNLEFEESLNSLYYDFFLLVEEAVVE